MHEKLESGNCGDGKSEVSSNVRVRRVSKKKPVYVETDSVEDDQLVSGVCGSGGAAVSSQVKKSARKRTEKVVEVQVSVEPAITRTSNRVLRQEGQYTEMSDQHIDQVSAQSIDSITAEEAERRIRNLDKWPTTLSRPVVSNHRFEYYKEGKKGFGWPKLPKERR